MGAWKVFPMAAILAGVGIVVGVAYILRAIAKGVLFGRTGSGQIRPEHPLEPISVPERIGAIMLLATRWSSDFSRVCC